MASSEERSDTCNLNASEEAENGRTFHPSRRSQADLNSKETVKLVTQQSNKRKFKMAAKFDLEEPNEPVVPSEMKESASDGVFHHSDSRPSSTASNKATSASTMKAATSDPSVASSLDREAVKGSNRARGPARGRGRGKRRGRGRGGKEKEPRRPGNCYSPKEPEADKRNLQGGNQDACAPNIDTFQPHSSTFKPEHNCDQYDHATSETAHFRHRAKGTESDHDVFYDAEDNEPSLPPSVPERQEDDVGGFEHASPTNNEPTGFGPSNFNQHMGDLKDSSFQKPSNNSSKKRNRSKKSKLQPHDDLQRDQFKTTAKFQKKQESKISSETAPVDDISAGPKSACGKIVVRGFDPSMDIDLLSMYFESSRKSGGGEVDDVQIDQSGSSAIITFTDSSVIENVLGRIHILSDYTLTVEEKIDDIEKQPQEIHMEDVIEDPETVLEVSGFKPGTSEDTLSMHFESSRRSGGGEVIKVWINETQNKATVKFADQTVIDRVLKKSHNLDGSPLNVLKKTSQAPRPIDGNRLFLRGLPDGIQGETLSLFLENRTNIPEDPEIVYGQQPGTAMLHYAQEITDLDKIIKRFREKKLQNATVLAEKVQVTNCVLVRGISTNRSKDMLELYFDNHRKSGGGLVSDVQIDNEEDCAVVVFEEYATVNGVLNRRHTLSGETLSVTAHYECLGTVISTDGPVPVIPNPITQSADPLLMDYIMTKYKDNMDKELRKHNTEVLWPFDSDKSKVVLKPLPNEENVPSVWRKWKEISVGQFKEFLQKFSTDTIHVSAEIWSNLSDILAEITVGNVDVHQHSDTNAVLLVGLVSELQAAKVNVMKTIEELEINAKREAETIDKTLPMSPLRMKIIKTFGILAELKESFQNVDISISKGRGIIFKGIRGEISEAQVSVYNLFESLNTVAFDAEQCVFEYVDRFCDVINDNLIVKGLECLCNVQEGKITLYSKTPTNAQRSLKFLKEEFVSKQMKIDKEATMKVLRSKKATDKINTINEEQIVIMRVDTTNKEVRITGNAEKVEAAVADLGQFLDENVIIEKRIPILPRYIQYMNEYCGKKLSEIQRKHPDVSINPAKNCFIIKGNEKGTDEVALKFESLKSKMFERQQIVDKPGIPELLRGPKGQRTLQRIARTCQCVISDYNGGDIDAVEEVDDSPSADSQSEVVCHFTAEGGCQLLVCKGDLTKEAVDAIVNAANPDLDHIGGLAKAIVDAGGDTIQRESYLIKQRLGRKLKTSEAVCTGAGRLPCRHVIHVPGPMWPRNRRRRRGAAAISHEEDLLFDAVTNSLKQADDLNLKSIALPAISSGVYGFPLDLCAKTIIEATLEFINSNQSSLREIRFTNVTVQHSVAFQEALMGIYGHAVVAGDPTASPGADADKDTRRPDARPVPAIRRNITATPRIPPSTTFDKHDADTIATKEGIKIVLMRGTLASEQADVIVNTAGGDMKLNKGNVSKALLQAGGPGLQTECDQQVTQGDGSRQDVAAGDFIETGPANLTCKKVFHLHCPGYNQNDSLKTLKSMLKKILEEALKQGMTSIAIPAIGTGNLSFPRDVTARVMYETVVEFSKDNPTSVLNDIRFWVYDKDVATVQAFETEMQKLTTATPAASLAGDFGATTKVEMPKRKMKRKPSAVSLLVEEPAPAMSVATPMAEEGPVGIYSASSGSSNIKFGSVVIQLQQGDLVQESTDVIVNTVGRDLSLKGVVSRALIKGGGSIIADECNKIRNASKSVPQVAMTTAGKLPSKKIIHVALSGPDKVKKMTREILQLAEKSGMQSVAFPALGTGNLGGSVQQVAPDLIDAIGEFATQDKPTNLQLVKLVIFQQDMIPMFEETMKSKAGASYKKHDGFLKRGMKAAWGYATGGPQQPKVTETKSVVKTESKPAKDTITIYIVSDEKSKLDKAVDQIQEYIDDEFHSEELIPDGDVVEFTDAILKSIQEIGSNHKVKVVRKPTSKGILLEGPKVAVMSTKADTQTLFARIQAEEKRKTEDTLLSKDVQWRYKTDAGIFDDYDEQINGLIEKAYRDKQPCIDLDMEDDDKIRIDITNMVEVDLTGGKTDMEIHRADLKAETKGGVLPTNWIPMGATENLKIVQLVQGSAEYNQVEQTFKNGPGGYPQGNVVKIERIQNKELITQYAARNESMKTRLGRDSEKKLYHGTSKDTVDKVNLRGFNRSFCGKNAVAFGQGTYFARDARYSAQDRYSQRDANNQKYIYMCKVLVGDSVVGDSTIIVPPPKPNSSDIYDSTVDNVQNPSVVVIYHDAQAYPEYLITFT